MFLISAYWALAIALISITFSTAQKNDRPGSSSPQLIRPTPLASVPPVASAPTAQQPNPRIQKSCKWIPGNQGWPSEAEWSQLSAAVKGRLTRPPPAAAACHRNVPGARYDAAQCDIIREEWKDSKFHAQHPTSNMWQNYNNYSCTPDAGGTCTGVGYPVYVVQAKEASDVKAAVDFARTKNIRLNIKSTGHDFLGRWVHLET
jgi:hypothetical protein